ncbi:MAG TPA: hypothetical protein PLU30_11910 [Verrucomicrobiae bacterium]|nr:hypothetical protein [Verrucomicrobiae bacterium]
MTPRRLLLLAATVLGAGAWTAFPAPGGSKDEVGQRALPAGASGHGHRGVIAITKVNESGNPDSPGARITALRVVEVFPRGDVGREAPSIGYAAGTLARGVLGTVGVEADGSARFEVPAGVDFYMQALDERGRAIVAMRSATRLRPGETRVCGGCHDPARGTEPAGSPEPLAWQKPPARLEPESHGSYPLSFPRLVQPILDRNCIGCHDGRSGRPDLRSHLFETENKDEISRADRLCGVESLYNGWTHSYVDLRKYAWFAADGDGVSLGKEAAPDRCEFGARASQLMQRLDCDHGNCGLSDEDRHRIALWLDCGSPFYGAYHDAAAQAGGGLVPPRRGYLPEFEN